MASKKKIKITENDLKMIYGNDYEFFQNKIIPNCFCGKCCVGTGLPMVTIKDYEIFLNHLNDIELQGFCADCGGPVGRYLETGAVKEYNANIKKFRKLNENIMENQEEFKRLLEDYLEKQKIAREFIKQFIVSGSNLDRIKLLSVKPFNKPDFDKYKLLKQAEKEAHQKWLEFARK